MHQANRHFWLYCHRTFPQFFTGAIRVVEFGSHGVCGVVNDFLALTSGGTYVGVDWRAGPNVHAAMFAHQYQPDEPFHCVVSASMLEHDPHWELSVNRMVDVLRDDGALFLTWGASRNPRHCEHHAIDGRFHALPAGRVLSLLRQRGMHIHLFRYEGLMFPAAGHASPGGMGEVACIASKHRMAGDVVLDELLADDLA